MEIAVLHFFQSIRSEAWDYAVLMFSRLGDFGLIWIVSAIVLLLIKRWRKAGLCVSGALLLDFIFVNLILKPLFGRERPCDLYPTEDMLIACLSDHSFPSGHTAAAFAFATALALKNKKAGAIAFVFAFLMGLSRLYLFVHFPTDVLAGALFGMLFGWLGYRLAQQFFEAKKIGLIELKKFQSGPT